ncbi:uncharacterized protein F5Z01DRAFT_488686 [Emericellopsis atlantica]|uniref:Uncharacterized protein n=1 Tax=Emericellopsis atlantica TaxID=2614577 RepID=A0A9P8CS38_9HYPO|nr:uncharacterized protein F5Z01DRAFT_488686 [Emericellopsis atlantica]KAG9256800.1 hypothetical protein F5Z01DRAFT_488686 [Emericellopsis atlantica]
MSRATTSRMRTRSSRQLPPVRRRPSRLPQTRTSRDVYSFPGSDVSEEDSDGDAGDNQGPTLVTEPAGHLLHDVHATSGGQDHEDRTVDWVGSADGSFGYFTRNHASAMGRERLGGTDSHSVGESDDIPADPDEMRVDRPEQSAAPQRAIAGMFEDDASSSFAEDNLTGSDGESSDFENEAAEDALGDAPDTDEEPASNRTPHHHFGFFTIPDNPEHARQANLDSTELQSVLYRMGQYLWAGTGHAWESKMLARNITSKASSHRAGADSAQKWMRWHKHDIKTVTARNLALDTYKLWQLLSDMPAASDTRAHLDYLRSKRVSHQLKHLMLAINQSVNGLVSYPKIMEGEQTEKYRRWNIKVLQDIRQNTIPLLSLVLKMAFVRGSTIEHVDTRNVPRMGRFLSPGLQMLLRIARWLQRLIERACDDHSTDSTDPPPHQVRIQQGRASTRRCVRTLIEQVCKAMEEVDDRASARGAQAAAAVHHSRARRRRAESRLEEEEIEAKLRRFEEKTGGMYQGLARRKKLERLQQARAVLSATVTGHREDGFTRATVGAASARRSWEDLPPPPDLRAVQPLSSREVYASENGGWFYEEDKALLRELRNSRGSPRVENVQCVLKYRREKFDIIKRLRELETLAKRVAEQRGIDIQ